MLVAATTHKRKKNMSKFEKFTEFVYEQTRVVLRRNIERMFRGSSEPYSPDAVRVIKEEIDIWKQIANKAVELDLDNPDVE